MSTLDVLQIYDVLHEMPEISTKEFKTSAYLADQLKNLGYEVQQNVGGTGVIGTMKGSQPGLTFALHADIDALQHVKDGTKYCYHSCGHDANSATVLAVADRLKDKIIRGTLKIVFQPAEETLIGAKAMIAAGAADDIDQMISTHLRPMEELKHGQATPALYHSSSAVFDIKVHGSTGHAARPHQCINPIHAASVIIQAINSIQTDPRVPASVKVTYILSDGGSSNAIPASASLVVDARSQTNEVMQIIKEKLNNAVQLGAKSVGATAEVTTRFECPGAKYDETLVKELGEAIGSVLGKENVVDSIKTVGGEDFHFFAHHKPSLKTAFLGVGCDLAPGLHNPDMTFTKSALLSSVEILTKLALQKLG